MALSFGRKPKLDIQQIAHARKLIESGELRDNVAALFKVDRSTICRALANS